MITQSCQYLSKARSLCMGPLFAEDAQDGKLQSGKAAAATRFAANCAAQRLR